MSTPAHGGPWSALGAGFAVLFVAGGVNFTFGILFKPILTELGWDRATLALAATASLAINGLSQPFFGTLIDRVGPRRVILPSLALMAAGTALMGLAWAPWQMVLLYGVITSAGHTGSGILPVSVHVTRWFPRQRGFVMAVAASGFSLGQLVFTQLAARLEVAVGWRRTYGILAATLAAFLLGVAGWLRDTPSPMGSAAAAGRSLSRGAAMATPAFWAVVVGFVGCGFTDFLLTTHLAPFATDLGLSPLVAANAFSLWAAANVVGILAGGWIATRIGPRRALVATYGLRALSFVVLLRVRRPWQLYLFATLFGATFFTTAPLTSTLVGELFGPAAQGLIFGTASLFHHLAGALGAYAGGLAFDLTRSYAIVFAASGLLVVVSAAVTSLVRPPRRERSGAPPA